MALQQEVDGSRMAGKVALVTGASRGIGAGIARRMAAEGAAVACAARTLDPDPRYEGTLKDTVEVIQRDGNTAQAFQADLSKTEDRHRLVEEVKESLGNIDILVNNAAVTFLLPIDTFPEKRFRLMIETQVWAPIELSQLCIPGMKENGGGWILNISSRSAVKPLGPPFDDLMSNGGFAVYGLCKAALDRLSVGMAGELYKYNIAVNTLAPWDNVATSGASAHDLVADFKLEDIAIISEAAMQLCAGDRSLLTGRNAYSQAILAELFVAPRALDGGPFVPEPRAHG